MFNRKPYFIQVCVQWEQTVEWLCQFVRGKLSQCCVVLMRPNPLLTRSHTLITMLMGVDNEESGAGAGAGAPAVAAAATMDD